MLSNKRFLLFAVIIFVVIATASCAKKEKLLNEVRTTIEEDENDMAENNETISSTPVTDVVEEKEQSQNINNSQNVSEDKKTESIKSEEVKTEAAKTEDKPVIEIKTPLWSCKTEGGIASSPIILENTIYFGSKDGNLYAIHKDTGEVIWKYNVGTSILCQPALLDHTLFFSSSEVYYAVDALTGELTWSYDNQANVINKGRKDSWDYHDSSPVVSDGIVYFGSVSGAILGFDVTSGEIKWELKGIGTSAVRCTVLISDGILYYADWAGNFRAVDMITKNTLWENSYNQAFQSGFAMTDGMIFIAGRDTKIQAIDSKTGEMKWSYRDTQGSWITGDPVIVDKTLYISTSDSKKVYAMNTEDGSIISEYPIYRNSFTKVLIDNGLLYVTSGDAYSNPGSGKLQVYTLEDDSQCKWEVDIPTGGIFTSPVLANGIVYFGSEDGCFYAVDANSTVTQ